MNREHEPSEDLVILGAASVETKGDVGNIPDDTLGFAQMGLTDD